MADNKFSMLVDDENEKNVVPETKEEIDKNTTTIDVKSSDVDDVNWTVQQTKNRRLAPSFSLSRHDLGADSPRAKIAQSPATTLAFSPPPGSNAFLTTPMSPTSALKKKVVRFSRDELLALRKPTKIMPAMKAFADIVSFRPLDPVCLHPLEQEEIQRLWSIERQHNKEVIVGRGRGNRIRKGDEDTADWSKSDSSNGWDDSGNLGDALAFDLADMSAAALKFQSETLNLSSFNDPSKVEAEDVEEDETELPEWAEEDVMPINRNENMSAEASNKRNLLMGALQLSSGSALPTAVLSNPVTTEVDEVKTVASTIPDNSSQDVIQNSQPSVEDDTLLLLQSAQSVLTQQEVIQPKGQNFQSASNPIMKPFIQTDEWYYTDPQNNIQGPFSTENMRAWNEAGYFTLDLPLKLSFWNSFHELATIFPNYMEAFKSQPAEPRQAVTSSLINLREVEESRLRQLREIELAEEKRKQEILEEKRKAEQAALLELENQRIQQVMLEQRLMEQRLMEQRLREFEEQRKLQEQVLADQQKRQYEEQQHKRQQQIDHHLEQQFRQEQQRLDQQRIELQRFDQHRLQQQQHQQAQQLQQQQLQQQQQTQIQQQAQMHQRHNQQLQQSQQPSVQMEQKRLQDEYAYHEQEKRVQEELQFQRKQLEALEIQRKQHIEHSQHTSSAVTMSNNLSSNNVGSITQPAPLAPWARPNNQEAGKHSKETLLEIQRREQAEAEEANRQREASLREQLNRSVGWGNKPHKNPSLSAKSLLDIQLEEERIRQFQAQVQSQSQIGGSNGGISMSKQLKSILGVQNLQTSAVGSNSQGWSNVQQQGGQTKSIREIMEQEQKDLSSIGQISSKAPMPGTWAAKAFAPGSPQFTQLQRTSQQQLQQMQSQQQQSQQQAMRAIPNQQTSNESFWNFSDQSTFKVNPQQQQISQQQAYEHQNQQPILQNNENELGLPKEFLDWCLPTLRRMNANVDLTLIQFCFSLQSAGEIREYLAEYLGSTAIVSQFATEFIKRKELIASTNQKKGKRK